MRGDYQIPTDDWDPRDTLAEMTDVYERDEVPEGSAPLVLPVEPVRLAQATQPVVIAPIAYVPMQRYEIPTIAPLNASAPQIRISERLDATHVVPRAPSWHNTALAAGIVGAIAIGVSVGIAVSSGGSELEAPAAVVTHAPVSRPIVTPIEEPAPVAKRIALVDVRIDSQPAGANATLIDGDKATPLGATPLAVELDPRRNYDVMIALSGHATKVVHVSPSSAPRVTVEFEEAGRHAVRRARSGR
jgi:hypothetical protein